MRDRLSLGAYTERVAAAHRRSAGGDAGAGAGAGASPVDFVPRSMRPDALAASAAHRCKWILANTMGAGAAFGGSVLATNAGAMPPFVAPFTSTNGLYIVTAYM